MASRRNFLNTIAALGGAALLPDNIARASVLTPNPSPISCNSYNWITFYGRQGKTWMADPDASLAEFARTGITAYEPGVSSLDEVIKLGPLLKKHGLTMPSLYVNSTLHRADKADASIQTVLAIADAARTLGTQIIVTNPEPIKWGSMDDKSDAELTEQALNLNTLGAELRRRGQTLAYHTHAPEHRQAAREFHHCMLATDLKNVALCLDAHWVYRGSGNSQVALFDVVNLYGSRIVEVHIRQSTGGVWNEVFTPTGDIDYTRLARELRGLKLNPQLVIEQCLETGSPNTLDVVSAHRQDLVSVRAVFS
jgi:inosose dehydratase